MIACTADRNARWRKHSGTILHLERFSCKGSSDDCGTLARPRGTNRGGVSPAERFRRAHAENMHAAAAMLTVAPPVNPEHERTVEDLIRRRQREVVNFDELDPTKNKSK